MMPVQSSVNDARVRKAKTLSEFCRLSMSQCVMTRLWLIPVRNHLGPVVIIPDVGYRTSGNT